MFPGGVVRLKAVAKMNATPRGSKLEAVPLALLSGETVPATLMVAVRRQPAKVMSGTNNAFINHEM